MIDIQDAYAMYLDAQEYEHQHRVSSKKNRRARQERRALENARKAARNDVSAR